jgi:hypothetical protein
MLGIGRAAEASPLSFPLREAQRMELDSILAEMAAADPEHAGIERFARGEAVRWIRRTGPMLPAVSERALMVFWSPLDSAYPWHARMLDRATDAERRTMARVDCLVALLTEEIGLVFQLADSSLLAPAVARGDSVA